MAKIRLWCVGEEMCTEKRYSMGVEGKMAGGMNQERRAFGLGKQQPAKISARPNTD